MDAWVWWVIAAAGLAAVEVFTLDLVFIMLAGGSLAAAGVAGGNGNVALQLAIAVVVALVGLAGLRPVALRHLKTTPELRTGTAGLVGQEALVLEDVGPHGGRVKLAGEVWSARSYDGASTFPAGESIAVLQIDGATALVG
ncbi:MAG TPA: NfeD family protein [Sporichthya sp.]|nr:NfeD family protein [Sporichthya sp.]